MAMVEREGVVLRVKLRWWERLGALHGDLRVPLNAMTAIGVSDMPWREIRGLRAPGTAIPRLVALGQFRTRRSRDFVAAYRHRPAVVIQLQGAKFNRVIVSVNDPEAVAANLRQCLGPVPLPHSTSGFRR
jgi:hypothetical protein